MLIKPFLVALTKAEMHQVMCSGFATIAGSVLVAYISLGVNGTALISSCSFPVLLPLPLPPAFQFHVAAPFLSRGTVVSNPAS